MINETEIRFLKENIGFWNNLSQAEQDRILQEAFYSDYPDDSVLYKGEKQCLGFIIVVSGQLRCSVESKSGKGITLYRLLDYDMCVLSASCIMKNINFDITVTVEKETKLIIIPASCIEQISNYNIEVKNYIFEVMSSRFSDSMWVLTQFVFSGTASRLASFLLEHSSLNQSDTITVTHEFIANDLGTAREVVTRMLNHFSNNLLVSLSRGVITILDKEQLINIVEQV